MNLQQIITELDKEIILLTQVRALLTSTNSGNNTGRKRRTFSPEALKRIAQGQHKRWAKVRAAKRVAK